MGYFTFGLRPDGDFASLPWKFLRHCLVVVACAILFAPVEQFNKII